MRREIFWLGAVVAGCLPTFEEQPFVVDEVRVLAIRGVPAEARPNTTVTYEALVVSPEGAVTDDVDWSYCASPRRAEERTGVTASCAAGMDLVSIEPNTTLLSDACARFGPNPPPVEAGDPARRAADPDSTGGYYLPVRARAGEAAAFGFHRVRCDLPGATRAIFDAFQERYVDNQHPEILDVALETADGEIQDLLDGVGEVEVGQSVRLLAEPALAAAEPYVVYLPEISALQDRVEVIRVSWYVTGGMLVGDRYTAPEQPGAIHGWMVMGDSRGGSAWASFQIDVLPGSGGAAPL